MRVENRENWRLRAVMCPSTSRDDRAKAQEASYFVHRLRSPLPDSAETRRLWSTTKINSAKRKGSRSGNPASSAGSLDSCSPRDARVSAWIRYPCRAQPLNFLNYANWSAPVQRSCSIQRLKTKMSMNFLVQFVKKRSDVKEHTRCFYNWWIFIVNVSLSLFLPVAKFYKTTISIFAKV